MLLTHPHLIAGDADLAPLAIFLFVILVGLFLAAASSKYR